MGRWAKGLGFACGGGIVMVIAGAGAAYAVSGRMLGERHAPPDEPALAVAADAASVERGRHLATAVATCVLCHGEDLGGAV